jgi:hypothetical protein
MRGVLRGRDSVVVVNWLLRFIHQFGVLLSYWEAGASDRIRTGDIQIHNLAL